MKSFTVSRNKGRVLVQVRIKIGSGIYLECINEGDADNGYAWQVWEGFTNLSNYDVFCQLPPNHWATSKKLCTLRNELARLVPGVLELMEVTL